MKKKRLFPIVILYIRLLFLVLFCFSSLYIFFYASFQADLLSCPFICELSNMYMEFLCQFVILACHVFRSVQQISFLILIIPVFPFPFPFRLFPFVPLLFFLFVILASVSLFRSAFVFVSSNFFCLLCSTLSVSSPVRYKLDPAGGSGGLDEGDYKGGVRVLQLTKTLQV